MSRTRPNTGDGPVNPAQRFYEWRGASDKGYWQYYDKENQVNVPHRGTFSFLILDEFYTASGYNDDKGKGIYATEAHSTNQPIDVFISGDSFPFASGPWNDIKNDVKVAGGKFANAVYAMMVDENNEWIMVVVKMTGASIGPWIELKNDDEVGPRLYQDIAVYQREMTQEKKGSNNYLAPVFEFKIVDSREILDKAADLDHELQAFVDRRQAKKNADAAEVVGDVAAGRYDSVNALLDQDASDTRVTQSHHEPATSIWQPSNIPAPATQVLDEDAEEDIPF